MMGKSVDKRTSRHLLRPCGLAMRVELPELEGAEQLLDRRAGVAVGRRVDDPEPQPP